MKKKLRRLIISTFFGLMIASYFACTKEGGTGNTAIAGSWSKSSENSIQQYHFENDSTFVFTDQAYDAQKSKVLGFHYKTTGKYHLRGAQLSFYELKLFSSSNGAYVPEKDLVETPIAAVNTIYTVKIDRKQLSLFFDCPANASCVPSPIIYTKY